MARDLERRLPAAGGAGSGGGSSAAAGGRDIGLELSERIVASSSASSTSPYSPGSIEYGAASAAEVAGRIARENAGSHDDYSGAAAGGGGGRVLKKVSDSSELTIEAKDLKKALSSKDFEAEYEAILALAAKKEREGIFYEAAGLLNYTLNLCRASELSEDRRKEERIPEEKCMLRDIDTKRGDLIRKIAALENALNVSLGIGEISEEHKYDTSTRRYKLQLNEIREWTVQQLNRINENFVVSYTETGELSDEGKELEFSKAKEIEVLFKEISIKMRELTRQMLEDCMGLLGDPPCEYAIMCFGSMARNEMTPYSDIEWGILVDKEDDEVIAYFTKLSKLMQFRMINLGETILPSLNISELLAIDFFDVVTPRGFCMDGLMQDACKWPLGNSLVAGILDKDKFKILGLPESFKPDLSERNSRLVLIMSSFQIICESDNGPSLVERFVTEFQKSNDAEKIAFAILSERIAEYKETMGMRDKERQYFDIKKNIYRIVSLLSESLSLSLGLFEVSIWDKIRKYSDSGIDDRNELLIILALCNQLRLSRYLKAGKQIEDIVLREHYRAGPSSGEEKMSVKTFIEKSELLRIQYTLRPFLFAVEAYCAGLSDSKGSSFRVKFYDNSKFIQAITNYLLFEYDSARDLAQTYIEEISTIHGESDSRLIAVNDFMGTLFSDLGEVDAARESFDNALSILDRDIKSFYDRHESKKDQLIEGYEDLPELPKKLLFEKATILGNFGNLLLQIRGYEEALAAYEESLSLCRTIFKSESHILVISMKSNIAALKYDFGYNLEAHAEYHSILRDLEKLSESNSKLVASVNGSLGMVYCELGNYMEAKLYLDKELKFLARSYGAGHLFFAAALSRMSRFYLETSKYDEAKAVCLQAIEILKVNNVSAGITLITALANLGLAYADNKEFKEAVESIDNSIRIAGNIYPKMHYEMRRLLKAKAKILGLSGATDEAIRILEDLDRELSVMLDLPIEERQPTNADHAKIYNDLGVNYCEKEEFDKAIKLWEQANKFYQSREGYKSFNFGVNMNIAVAYQRMNDNRAAKLKFIEIIESYGEFLSSSNPNRLQLLYCSLANMFVEEDSKLLAVPHFEKALEIRRKIFGEDSLEVASLNNRIGEIYESLEESAEALLYYEKVLKTMNLHFGDDPKELIPTLLNIGDCEVARKEYRNAYEIFKRAVSIADETLSPKDENFVLSYLRLADCDFEEKEYIKALVTMHSLVQKSAGQWNEDHKDSVISSYLFTLYKILKSFEELKEPEDDFVRSFANKLLKYSDISDKGVYMVLSTEYSKLVEKIALFRIAKLASAYADKSENLTDVNHNLGSWYHCLYLVTNEKCHLDLAITSFDEAIKSNGEETNNALFVEYANFLIRNDRIDEARIKLEQVVRNRDSVGELVYSIDELEIVDEIIREEILKVEMVELNAQIFGKYLLIKILHDKGEIEERDRLLKILEENVDKLSDANIHKKMYCEVLRLADRKEAAHFPEATKESPIELRAALAAASSASAGGGGAVGGARASTIISSGDIISASRRDLNEREEESVAIFISLGDRAERIINTLIRSWRTRHAECSRAREEDGGSISRG